MIASLLSFLRLHWGILTLLLFTLAVRGGLMIAQFERLRDDPDSYYLIASNIVRFAVFSVDDPTKVGWHSSEPQPSAFRPPLYPVLLSNLALGKDMIIYWEAIAVTHLALGLATVWVTWRIARALQLTWGSYVAGVLVACDPILLNQQSLVMTETLATCCAVIAWGLLVRFHFDRNWWNSGLAGGAIGMAALCRPTFLPWLLVAAVIAAFLQPGRLTDHSPSLPAQKKSRQWGLRLLNATAILAAGLGVMFPWGWRNYQTFQTPKLTTTHGGYTLYLANNRHFYRYLREDKTGLPWDPQSETTWKMPGSSIEYEQSFRQERNMDLHGPLAEPVPFDLSQEFVLDGRQTRFAITALQQDPVGFLLAGTYRIRRLWSPLPYRLAADESPGRLLLRYLTAAWYLAVYALAAFGIYSLRGRLLRSPWLFGVMLALLFMTVHFFYWCDMRMRAPLMPIVAVVAATGAQSLRQLRSQNATGSSEADKLPRE